MKITSKEIQSIADVFKILGNHHRLQVILLLIGGEKNVGEINKHIKISQPALSQILRSLNDDGFLNKRRDKRNIFYFIIDKNIESLLEKALNIIK